MLNNYRIFKKFGADYIKSNDILRVDLFNNFKLKDIPELKKFTFIFFQKGHNELNRKIRYIKIFDRKLQQ